MSYHVDTIERTVNGRDYCVCLEIEAHDEFWVDAVLRYDDPDHKHGADSTSLDLDSDEAKAVLDTVDLGEFVADWVADQAAAAYDRMSDR
jgi:hypothetical protein